MKTRLYTSADYAQLRSWWVGRWGDAPSIYALPQSGLVAIGEDNKDLAAGWLYLDMTTPTALLAFMVTNPANTHIQSCGALIVVINGLKELAKSQGRTNIITICPKGSLGKLFRRCGFEQRDTDMEHLTIKLD